MSAAAILVVVAALFMFVLYILKTFRTMLECAKNPPWIEMFGHRLSYRMLEVLVYRAMSVPSLLEVHAQAMEEQAIDKIKELQQRFPEDGAARGGVILIGSDTFTYWHNFKKDITQALDATVINIAYGGTLTDVVHKHLEALVVRHNPTVVVYCCGENDLLANRKSDVVGKHILETHALLRSELPHARIVYLGTIITPLLRSLSLDIGVHSINTVIRESAVAKDEACTTFVEFDALGTAPPEDMFLGDLHHLSPEGHTKLASILLPVIRDNLVTAQVT